MSGGQVVCSVCVANYNGVEMIEACLDSILAQDCGFDFEILVHDDASTDASRDLVRRKYPKVRLLVSPENVGFCVANNRMVARSRGRYVLLLNNDAALLPDALRVLGNEAAKLERPAILSLPQYDFETRELLDMGSLLDPFLNSVPNRDPQRDDVAMVAGACLWISKGLWDQIGGFPEWFDSIGEDLYLCCRARLAGYPVRVLPVSGYRHRVGASFGGGKIRYDRLETGFARRALSERNKTFVTVLCCPAPWHLLLWPTHLLALALEGALLTAISRDARFWRKIYGPCFAALGQERQRLTRLRREIQLQRRIGSGAFWSVFHWLPHKVTMLFRYGLPIVR